MSGGSGRDGGGRHLRSREQASTGFVHFQQQRLFAGFSSGWPSARLRGFTGNDGPLHVKGANRRDRLCLSADSSGKRDVLRKQHRVPRVLLESLNCRRPDILWVLVAYIFDALGRVLRVCGVLAESLRVHLPLSGTIGGR